MLAEAEAVSGPLSEGQRAQSRPYPAADPLDDPDAQLAGPTYAYTYPQAQSLPVSNVPGGQASSYGDPYSDPYSAPRPDPYAQEFVDDESYPGVGTVVSRPRWSTGSKVIVAVSILLFIMACAIVLMFMGNRLFPQAKVYTSAQATETAIAAMRPAVNTPIISPPTITSQGVAFSTPIPPPTRQPEPPTAAPQPPTIPPPPPPTQTPQPQPQPQPPAPTAPPLQPQPQAEVMSAQMSVSLQGGAPVGVVSAYGPSDPFNLAVQANYGPGGVSSVVTRWYGPDGALIYEMRREYTQPGAYYAGFTLRTDGRWLPGSYRVDIHTNDSPTPAYSVPFTVLP